MLVLIASFQKMRGFEKKELWWVLGRFDSALVSTMLRGKRDLAFARALFGSRLAIPPCFDDAEREERFAFAAS